MIELFIGGARSGKSRLAEQRGLEWAVENKLKPVYLATGFAGDEEMESRIAHHKNTRSKQWRTIEEPIQIAKKIKEHRANSLILVDCLTLWISNCLHQNCWEKEKWEFLNVLVREKLNIIVVGNEVGQGITPINELARTFIDETGWLHQEIASLSDSVFHIVAGLSNKLK